MTEARSNHDRIMALYAEILELHQQIAAKQAEVRDLTDADQEDSPER